MTISSGRFSFTASFQLTSSQGGWPMVSDTMRCYKLFQLTSSQGGWLSVDAIAPTISIFQLTSSQGGWPVLHRPRSCYISFQLTSSQGGWHFVLADLKRIGVFQLTSSQGGWLFFEEFPLNRYAYFNSHPHKEDDRKEGELREMD